METVALLMACSAAGTIVYSAFGLVYLDPNDGNNPVGQVHPGAGGIAAGLGCRDCHTAAGGGMSMEVLVPRRGGVNTVTPIPPPPAP